MRWLYLTLVLAGGATALAPAVPPAHAQGEAQTIAKAGRWFRQLLKNAAQAVVITTATETTKAVIQRKLISPSETALAKPPPSPPTVASVPPPAGFKRDQSGEDTLRQFGLPKRGSAVPRSPSADQIIRKGFELPSEAKEEEAVDQPSQLSPEKAVEAFKRGYEYYSGTSGPQDPAKAEKWFRQAADGGHVFAQYFLAELYHFGDTGIEKNDVEAARWLLAAAERGLPAAQTQLAYAYHVGEGVPTKHRLEAFWYNQAARQGDPYAQFALARLYHDGHGVDRDYVLAFDWLNEAVAESYSPAIDEMSDMLSGFYSAASRGDPSAQYLFGRAYEIGVIGLLPRNYLAAASWYDQARRNGSRAAFERLCQNGWIPCR